MSTSRSVLAALFNIVTILSLSGCASTGGGGINEQEIRKQVQGLSSTTFAQPFPRVHDAAERALVNVGYTLVNRGNYFVSASRSRKIGPITGVGSETIKIYMLPQAATGTEMWVDAGKALPSFGKKQNLSETITDEMKGLLGNR